MCYYASLKANARDIAKELDVTFLHSKSFKPAYSVSGFGYPQMPVVSSETPDAVSLYTWGLIPFWVKTQARATSIRQRTLNARSETLFEKPAFRHPARNKRCLVIVDGFYEWRHVWKKTFPYYITLKSRQIFTLGGVWDSWTDPASGNELRTFSVVTTEANELMAKVHNSKKRMPLILPKENERDWLDIALDEAAVKEMMQPYRTDDMRAWPVAKKLNREGYNTEDETVTLPFEYLELPALD